MPIQRQTRANLIFLALFVLLCIPGAVILVHKKLQPGATRMDMPDVLDRRLPYMAPLPAPAGTRWVAPPRTTQWLTELNRQFTGGGSLTSAGGPDEPWKPLISDGHSFQITLLHYEGARTTLGIVLWNLAWQNSGSMSASAALPSGNVSGTVTSSQAVELPAQVRRELMSFGPMEPPPKITFVSIRFPARLTPGARVRIEAPTAAPDSITIPAPE